LGRGGGSEGNLGYGRPEGDSETWGALLERGERHRRGGLVLYREWRGEPTRKKFQYRQSVRGELLKKNGELENGKSGRTPKVAVPKVEKEKVTKEGAKGVSWVTHGEESSQRPEAWTRGGFGGARLKTQLRGESRVRWNRDALRGEGAIQKRMWAKGSEEVLGRTHPEESRGIEGAET